MRVLRFLCDTAVDLCLGCRHDRITAPSQLLTRATWSAWIAAGSCSTRWMTCAGSAAVSFVAYGLREPPALAW